ncbi:MAG: ribulose-phosphate 3-epimerase [Oscillospiraceae bacterium]|nr:ribulose-phosphate 3-epimerase [Oscillospiraceae bacterium]
MDLLISASVLNADLADLKNELLRTQEAGVDMIHLDVMDGSFTKSITFGDYVVGKLRPSSSLPFDTHLMVFNPTHLIPLFAKAGSDIITIHAESRCDIKECLKMINHLNVKAGLSVSPETDVEKIFPYLPLCDMVLIMSVQPGAGGQRFMPDALKRIKTVRKEADRLGLDLDIEVDGGINVETAPLIFEAGANIAVVGSYLFTADNMKEAVESIRRGS